MIKQKELLNLLADLYELSFRNVQAIHGLAVEFSVLTSVLREHDPDLGKKYDTAWTRALNQALQRASGVDEQAQRIIERLRRGEL